MCTIFCVILSTVIITGNGVVLDCYNTSIREYDGHQQTTVTGKACLRWDQFNVYSANDFPDATKSDAANFCRSPRGIGDLWCFSSTSSTWGMCGIKKCGDDGLRECGKLNIDKPTILGRNVTFSFTPDTYNPPAILEWQRSMNGVNQWKTLPLNYKFTQHERNMTYYLILTDSVRNNDEGFYRVHYYNETIHCWMDAGKLTLEADQDGRETGDDMSTTGKIETCVGLGSIVGSVIAVLAVGILIGVICTFFILTRKGNLKGSKKQQTPHPTMSQDIELTGPSSTLDTYEQLQNRTGTENRETYDSLEANSSLQPNSQSQYESLNQEAEKYHTYTDLQQSR